MAAQLSPPNAPREEFVPREQSDAPGPLTSPEGRNSTQKRQKERHGHSHLHVLRVTDQVPSRFQFHMGGKRRVCDAQTSKSEEQAHCCSRKKWPHDMAPGCGMRRSGGCFKRCSCPLRRAPAAQAAHSRRFRTAFWLWLWQSRVPRGARHVRSPLWCLWVRCVWYAGVPLLTFNSRDSRSEVLL